MIDIAHQYHAEGGCEADEGYGCTGHATGATLIADERLRQIEEEGWTPDHDDEHDRHDLVFAAIQYAQESVARQGDWVNFPHHQDGSPSRDWPWDPGWWKPGDDPVQMLVKAGALIAAEIDRLQRRADSGLHLTYSA